MKLLVWVQVPYTKNFFAALRNAMVSAFLSPSKNRILINELTTTLRECKNFIAQSFWEISVNAANLLPLKLFIFKRRLARHVKLSMRSHTPINRYEYLLAALGTKVNCKTSPANLSAILAPGCPLLVICNHPFPPIDALSVMATIQRFREDFWIISNSNNSLLSMFRQHTSNVIQLHMEGGLLGTKDLEAVRRTRTVALRRAISHIRAGECVIVFPAGQGSKSLEWGGAIQDLPWLSGLALIVEQGARGPLGLNVLPLFVEGHMGGLANSQRYQRAVIDHPNRLPAALQHALFHVPREVVIRIGNAIDSSTLRDIERREMVGVLRRAVYELSSEDLIAVRPKPRCRP